MKRIKIGDLCTLNYGKGLKAENRNKGHYPVYGSNGIVGYHDSYLVENSSIIIGRKGSIGEIHLSSSPCWPIDTTYYLSFKTKDLNINWFYRILKTLNLKGLNKSAAVPGLNREDVYSMQIPLPPLDDQIRIATVLTRAERLIAKRKESIKALDELLKSIFLEMFGDPVRNEKGWEKKPLHHLTKVGTGGTPSRKKETEYYNGNIFWAKTTEVNGNYIYDTSEKISELAISESNCKIYPVHTILLAMYGQGKTRGNVGYLRIEAATNQACAAILPSGKINQIFLFQFLKNSYEFLRSLARGGNQENLNLNIVGNVEIFQPPLPLQNQFAAIVEKVESIKAKQTQSLAEMENLYSSLSQRAFKGELDLSGVWEDGT